jgi:hypothetical protein
MCVGIGQKFREVIYHNPSRISTRRAAGIRLRKTTAEADMRERAGEYTPGKRERRKRAAGAE